MGFSSWEYKHRSRPKKTNVYLGRKERQFIRDMCEFYTGNLGHGLTMRGGERIYPSELNRLHDKLKKVI